jgi:hypothetical protein
VQILYRKDQKCSDIVYVGEHYEVCIHYGNLFFEGA